MPYNTQWYEIKDHFASAGPIVRADVVTSHGKPRGMGTVEFQDRESAQNAIRMFDRTSFKEREIFVREDLPPPEKQNGRDEFRPGKYDRYDRPPRDDRYDRPTRDDRYDRPPRDDRYDRPARDDRYDRRGGYDRYYDRYDGYDSYDRRDRFSRDTYAPPRRDFRREPKRERREARGFEVFIGNLPFSVKWQDLKDLFKEIGEVERADIIESTPGRSRGMGTVHFYNEADVEKAVERFNGFEWFGRKIDVRPSKFPKDDRAVPSTPKIRTDGLSKNTDFTLGVTGDGEESPIIYASNLPWETAESDLFELFGSIATVERAELQYGRGGNSSGNAVVKFSDVETARSVIQQLNGYEYGNRHLKITFAKFPSAEQLEALHEEIRKNTEETISSGLAEAPIERTSPVSEEHSKPAANPIEQSGAVDDGDEMIEE